LSELLNKSSSYTPSLFENADDIPIREQVVKKINRRSLQITMDDNSTLVSNYALTSMIEITYIA